MAYSIIDIGSNSVRYMDDKGEKRLITTRLAQGLDKTGLLCDESMARSLNAIGLYARLSRESGLTPRAYATSAVRDAKNSDLFLSAVYRETGIEIDVLSGEREAKYALLGAGATGGGLIDVGGGSSQIVFGGFGASFPMGCVRAKELFSDVPTFDEMQQKLYDACGSIFRFPRIYLESWTGVGGTITTLAALSLGLRRYDQAAVNACVLTPEGIAAMARDLCDRGDAVRGAHPLLTDRHDVIVPGALIVLLIMRGMGIAKLRVSDADGMEGYLKELLSAD